MFNSALTNVPAGTANFLAYTMIVVVAIFLLSGPIITYYYWRKNKRMKAALPTDSA
jgi:preprotein translocase subunit SecG